MSGKKHAHKLTAKERGWNNGLAKSEYGPIQITNEAIQRGKKMRKVEEIRTRIKLKADLREVWE